MKQNIPVPPKTKQALIELVQGQMALKAQADAVLATLREALEVPDDYVLLDLNIGFQATPTSEGVASNDATVQ